MIQKTLLCQSIQEAQDAPRALLVPTDGDDNSYIELKISEAERANVIEGREYTLQLREVPTDVEPVEEEPVPDAIAEQAAIDAAKREEAELEAEERLASVRHEPVPAEPEPEVDDVNIDELTADGLREQLEARGLDTKGNKPELYERLAEALTTPAE